MRDQMNSLYWMIAAIVCIAMNVSTLRAQKATGFFRTEKIDGRWWLIDPNGKPFISKGVTTVMFYQDTIKGTNISPIGDTNRRIYGTEEAWRKKTAERLIGWGFNTLGAWSDEKLCDEKINGTSLICAPTVDFVSQYAQYKKAGHAWLHGYFPDIFAEDFEKFSYEHANKVCGPRKESRAVLGWFSDNELRWNPDWRTRDELLTSFLELKSTEPGRKVVNDLLEKRHGNIAAFNKVWKTAFASWEDFRHAAPIPAPIKRKEIYLQNQAEERNANEKDPERAAFVGDCDAFLALLAERYFRITTMAIKAAAPNHMAFGPRFAYVPSPPVVAEASKYLDAVSFNCYDYDGHAPAAQIQMYSVFDKPMIIGEFSYKAKDSGLPNTKGAGIILPTQQERADAFARYVKAGLATPYLVGYHWFEYADQPKEGRFDGENSNFGIISIEDKVYEPLAEKMKEINEQAEKLHRQ